VLRIVYIAALHVADTSRNLTGGIQAFPVDSECNGNKKYSKEYHVLTVMDVYSYNGVIRDERNCNCK
jgi:hypothetical protein